MSELYSFQGKNFDSNLLDKYNLKKIILSNLNNEECYLTYIENKNQIHTYSFKKISEYATKIAFFLNELNLDKNARIGIAYPNTYEIIPIVLGAILAEKSFQLLNPIDNTQPILTHFTFNRALDFYIDLNKPLPEISFNTKTFDIEKEFCLFSSSGTTGFAKGVVHDIRSIIANLTATIDAHQLNTNKTIFNCLPLYHVNGFNFAFLSTFFSGAKLILTPSFNQPMFFNIIENYNPQIINLVPTIIRVLNEDPRQKSLKEFSHYIVSAASFLSLNDAKDFYKKYQLPIIQSYGLSETVNFSTISPTNFNYFTYEEYLNIDNQRLSIGSNVYGNDIFILKNSPDDMEGEICIRGWNVFKGYLNNSQENEKAFKDNYFHTGDLGFSKKFHDKDYFFISGRIKEVIKFQGTLFHLIDIDNYFLENTQIKNCVSCSYFVDGDEKLGALVSTNLSEKELINYFNTKYDKQLKLDRILITNDLPIGLTGKKNRNEASKRIISQRKV